MTRMPLEQFHDFSIRPTVGPEDIMACEAAKNAILKVMNHPGVPPKLFLTGPPGSGKSSLIHSAVRLVACQSPDGLVPCRTCKGCQSFQATGEKCTTGLFSEFAYWDCDRPIDYLAINCRNTTVAAIEEEFEALRGRTHALRIIHLEEAGSLYKERRDEVLTVLMDDPDYSTCRWFATAVSDQGLDEQFRRRWTLKATTSPPSVEALAESLALHCRHFKIGIDDPSTWTLLAKSSWGVVGHAYALLASALTNDPPFLTKEMVAEYPFPAEDPWDRDFFQRRRHSTDC